MSDQATCHCRPESKVDLHAVEVPCGDVADALNKAFSRAIHDAWQQGYEQAVRDRKPRTITTVEELDALPIGAMVLDAHGDVARRYRGGWRTMVSETDSDPWLTVPLEDATLPATVLYEPLS